MVKDTVLLDIKDYNELRDFKQKIEEGKTFFKTTNIFGYSMEFMSTDDAFSQICEINEKLSSEIENLKNKNKNLSSENINQKQIDDLKKMTYWEFRKWKKNVTIK